MKFKKGKEKKNLPSFKIGFSILIRYYLVSDTWIKKTSPFYSHFHGKKYLKNIACIFFHFNLSYLQSLTISTGKKC